jgi:hypothetical protein
MTRNPKPYHVIEEQVVKPLNLKVKSDSDFAKKAQAALAGEPVGLLRAGGAQEEKST